MTLFEEINFSELEKQTRSLSLALDFRDSDTRQHSERVKELCIAMSECFQLSPAEKGALRVSAIFHDIGKIGIPDNILMKPEKLNAEEWVMMRKHPAIGEQLLLSTEMAGAVETAQIIRQHHEHHDGSGYPDGLLSAQISIGAKIISIVDSYDAMSYTRAYHRPKGHDQIMQIIEQETGIKHDPEIFKVFKEMIEKSPLKVT